tara:strand:- start:4476 stop:4622 length:147 start_codon:yes stop_codon:yes gene_type:complete
LDDGVKMKLNLEIDHLLQPLYPAGTCGLQGGKNQISPPLSKGRLGGVI